jgi:endonuclease/exonuclease/phosphatase family metal-dependent hydrolase
MYMDDETHNMNLARDPSGKLRVKAYTTQEVDAKFDLLDNRTSQKMETVQKDRLVAYPVWNRAKEDYQGVDIDGKSILVKKGDYIDYQNQKIPEKDWYDSVRGRVPIYSKETGRFSVERRHFDYFRQEAQEKNAHFRKMNGREPNYFEKVYPEEAYLQATLEMNEGHSRGWALQYGEETQTWVDSLNAIDKAIEHYKELDESIPEDEKWRIMKDDRVVPMAGAIENLIPMETKHPLKVLEEARSSASKRLEFSRQASTSQEQQAEDTNETKKNIITPIKRLEQSGTKMYAEAGIHALQKTKDPNNPVVVAIENLFPERFGGHLEELKWVIKKSRERMVELLTEPKIQLGVSRKPVEMTEERLIEAVQPGKEGMLQENPYYKGISRGEAEKLAADHIKATLDTGHLNMWKKFWQEDPHLNKEQNETKFKEWYLQQVESLAKEDMVGNVHLADNYGYQDDHLSPGQGNAPIKEVVAILKKHGYDSAMTVEPGADATTDLSDFHGLMKTWRHFGSSIYGMAGGGGAQIPQKWTDVQYSYFGQNRPPYFVFGPYAPSNDWTLWSAVPME